MRSLGCLDVASSSSPCASSCPCGNSRPLVSTSNRFDIFDDFIPVPIEQLIKVSTRRPRKKRAASRIGMPVGPSGHAAGGFAQVASLVRVPHGTEPGSSLGIEGWALCNFVETEDIDIFSKLPQVLLGGSGLAPLPADGHVAGDDDTFIKAIRDDTLIVVPSAPLFGGGAAPPVAVGHRAGDESYPKEAAAASMEPGEMSHETAATRIPGHLRLPAKKSELYRGRRQ